MLTWALWPDPPRQREYLDASACLLADEKGITTEPAKQVWSALQDASAARLVRVRYLQVNGPQTAENAATYLASLANSRCGTIIATGTAQTDAVTTSATAYPALRFITIDGGTTAANVQELGTSDPEALKNTIRGHIDTLADAAS